MEACVGACVWVPQETGWAQASVLSCEGSQLRVRRQDDGHEFQLDGAQVHLYNKEDVEDMTNLAFLHEPGVLWNLQSRYQQNNIYTYTGSILIAVNPFQPLPHLYGTDAIDRYHRSSREELPPHVYATACAAYRNMMRDEAGQAILVTGESGAGKTETAKLIMACLTHLGAAGSGGSKRGRGMSGVEQKILESNPLLEAFGNAKTLRNNNSSRFGKYVEIFFDPAAGGAVTGAAVRTYLLERSRVVAVNNPERSFHIFYQLVYGASREDRAAWKLPLSAADFAYLARSSCVELPGQSNAEEYQHTRRAMSHIGLSEEQQRAVLATVAAVLHMGNIAFVDAEHHGANGHSQHRGEGAVVASSPASQAALATAAELLGVDAGQLAETLTTRQIQTREGPISTPLSSQAAADARDSMAKVVYARLFDWLVAAVNAAVDEAHNGGVGNGNGSGAAAAGGGQSTGHLSIGLLDIYGFESFEVNDLEQLCINLTNEKLQQHFNQHVFKWEQDEYDREGVDWSYISFKDNADVLELLEGRMGLMDLLDETCRFPKATADDLAHKYGTTSVVANSSRFSRCRRPATSFCIDHYAGSVTYSTLNFLDKNRDYVVGEHQALLGRSTRPLLQEVFGPEGGGGGPDAGNGGNGSSSSAGGGGAGGGGAPGRSQFQFRSVSTQCRRQLAELMSALSQLQPHYVRCIKPNATGSPVRFDAPYSLQQLRCGGVMEAVRIACAGYAYRRPYAAFLEYFWQLCPEPVHALRRRLAERQRKHRRAAPCLPSGCSLEGLGGLASLDVGELRPAAEAVLAATGLAGPGQQQQQQPVSLPPSEGVPPGYHLGATKVFLRATSAAALERQRLAATGAAATVVQAHFRRWQMERWYRRVRQAVITIQAYCRGHLARREAHRLRCERAAVAIQRAWRGAMQRLRFQRLRAASVLVQAVWRGVLARRAVEAMRRERAALVLQTAWRAAVVRREYLGVLRYWRAAVVVQAAWRGYAARQLYRQILPLHRTALTLQRIWRSHRHGSQLAERLRSALMQYWQWHKAAVVMQAAWRAKAARQVVRRVRLQQRRARFLAAANCFASEAGAAPLPTRPSPEAARRTAAPHTPVVGIRTYSHSYGGNSAGKGGRISAESTPVAAGEVVRGDDVAGLPDRDNRVKARVAELQDFKVSPLVQYWQHKEAAAVDGPQRPGSASRKGNGDNTRRCSLGAAAGSPLRFMATSPYGPQRSPMVCSPPDTDDQAGGLGGRGAGRSATATTTTLDDAGSELAISRGGTASTIGDVVMADFDGSRGGSTSLVEDAMEVEMGSGTLSCEASYGQLLGGSGGGAAAGEGHDAVWVRTAVSRRLVRQDV